MGVQRFVAVAVIDLDVVAVRVVPAGGDDGAGVGSVNRRAVGGADVRAAVAVAHPAADILVAGNRPDEGTGAELGHHTVLQLGASHGDLGDWLLQHVVETAWRSVTLAVDHRNLVGDVLEAVYTFLQGDGLAEVVFIGLGLFGAERMATVSVSVCTTLTFSSSAEDAPVNSSVPAGIS